VATPAYRIVFQNAFGPGERDAWVVRLAIQRGDETVAVPDVVLSRRRAGELIGESGLRPLGRPEMTRVLLRYAVRRIEDAIRQGWEPVTEEMKVEPDDLPRLQAMLAEKTCEYKHLEQRDLYCSVAGDVEAIAVGLRRLAPTSHALCNACTLPATDYLCSHLHHPRVSLIKRVDNETSVRDDSGGWKVYNTISGREVQSALCDLDRPEISEPKRCHVNGHRCWERIVEADVDEPAAVPSPLALPEALDFLDATWQIAFGRRLFRARSAATDASLAVDARTTPDLDTRLSKLDDVFNAIEIDDDLLPAGTSIDKGQTLTRLVTCLKAELPAVADEMEQAVGVFRAVKKIRAAAQHPERRSEVIAAYSKLRLAWPSRNPGETWDGIRTRTIEAAAIIRDAVRGLGPRAARTAQASPPPAGQPSSS
jgi:hypothetical protein